MVSAHFVAAKMLKMEMLEIDEAEGKQLSAAITRVTELYDIPLPSEKIMAWVMLAKTCGDVYGTRLAAMAIQKKRPKIIEMQTQAVDPQAVSDFVNGGITQ